MTLMPEPEPREPRRRRILFYVADQWRGDTMTAAGHPCVDTPNLDALAADGVTFRRHYSTTSPCGPARTSMLTGLYQMNHRVVRNGTPLDARHTNIAYELRKAGIAPGMLGYTSNVPDPRVFSPHDPLFRDHHGVMQGFDALAPGLPWNSAYMGWVEALGYDLPDDPEDFWLPAEGAAAPIVNAAPARFAAEHSPTAFLTDRAIDYLSVRRDQDWFMHVAALAPHPPFIAPAPYNTRFGPGDVPPPVREPSLEAASARHPLLAYLLRHTKQIDYIRAGRGLVADLGEADIRQVRATYYGMISETDHHFGELVRYLKKTGQYDDTLIIFTSDHGEQLGDHWLLGKAGFFDSAYHIPLIIKAPGAAATRGSVVGDFTESIDVVPTILDWLGAEIPETWDGESLLPYLHGQTPPRPRDAIHYEHDFREVYSAAPQKALGLRMAQCSLAAIRDERFKYIHFPTLPPLLFDLREDPHEMRNLAGDPAHAATVRDYAQRMLTWRMEHMERTLTGVQAGPEGLKSIREPRR
ncbi:MAG: alkaline phosphatase family protein [Geminicoccaceae bacterium]